MADISAALKDWSATSGSNQPQGTTSIGSGLDNNLQELQGAVVRGLSHKGADIPSAGTTDLGAVEGLMHDITGITTISSFGTVRAGIWKILKFEGALTLTHNATSLILLGSANRTTAVGDVGIYISEGSGNWRELLYFSAAIDPGKMISTDGSQTLTNKTITGTTNTVGAGVLGTQQASTSGTSIDFTGIPSWAKKIIIQYVGVSTSGTSQLQVQIGDSGGIETTGYSNAAGSETAITTTSATGFASVAVTAAAAVWHGAIILSLENSATFTWVLAGVLNRSDTANIHMSSGSKSLSAALDRVRITTLNGTDTFDAGALNILYE